MIKLDDIRLKLIDAIKNSGLTQVELAKRLGLCQQSVGQYLHNNKMPALDTFANLCEILDLDANEILCVKRSESDRIKYSQTYVGEKIEVHNN